MRGDVGKVVGFGTETAEAGASIVSTTLFRPCRLSVGCDSARSDWDLGSTTASRRKYLPT